MHPRKINILIGAMVSFVLLSGFLFGKQDKEGSEAQAAQAAAATPAKIPEVGDRIALGEEKGKVVYKFENDGQMREFAGLWQQRRGIITRMAVLEAYLSEEGARLKEINSTFIDEYAIDMEQRFVLDSDRSLLVELETPEVQPVEADSGMPQAENQ